MSEHVPILYFLLANSIPLCGQTTFCFISGFQFMTITYNAAISVRVQVV